MPENYSRNQPPASLQNFPIVGIGASAGGLDAFKKFLENIPEDSGMAYVLVQHLAPSHESLLPQLLARVTSLPVFEITDEINLAPDHVYIIPENKMLTTFDGVLKLEPRDLKNKKNMPIDLFFSSLAEVHKSFAIGIVLSGTGFDGSKGLKLIKEEGGVTYAQNPDSATFNGMPQSAIQAGGVDFIMNPEAIPEHLVRIEKAYETNDAHSEDPQVDKNEEDIFKSIVRILRLRTGNDFTHYKEATIRRRIARRMLLTKKEEPGAYLNFLRNDKSEQDALFNDVLIPVSYFFRDSKIFETLKEDVFPHILKNKNPNESIRIWTAGCSTGEEAYSLAISLHEYLSEKAPGMKVQLFASDISENVITKARAAIYTKQDLQNVSDARLQSYFVKSDGNYHISKTIREMCVFAVHNFLKDPPFAKMDLISCRNVLIYLNPFLQKKAMTTFHYALKENGILFLGKSESASAHSNLFEPILKNQKIYTRKSVPGRYVPAAFEPLEIISPDRNTGTRKKNMLDEDFQKSAHAILFNKYTPPAVIIDEHKEIVHFHGDTSPFLIPSPGKPNFNILRMAREGLAFEMRNALLKTKDLKETVVKEDIPLKDLNYKVTIEVVPLDVEERHSLILFHKKEIPKEDKKKASEKKSAEQLRIKQLEEEIQQIREDIKRVTEDQEAANEELQSANEELLSNSEELQTLNEELETSAEELQSNNEELISVNDELMDRQDQLMASRMYSEAIVETIREPLLILDSMMRIKSANAAFYNFFNTSESEIEGKSFYEINNSQWNFNDFKAQLEGVLPHRTVIKDFEIKINISGKKETKLLINARQVVNDKHSDQLILLAFEDITEHQDLMFLEESEDRFRFLADAAPILMWLSGIDKSYHFFNKGWTDFTGKASENHTNDWKESVHPEDLKRSQDIYNSNFDAQKPFSIEYRLKNSDGDYRWILDKGTPRFTNNGVFLGYVGACIDIDETKNFSRNLEEKVNIRTEELRDSRTFLESILNTIQGVVYVYDFEKQKAIFINENILEATGIKSAQITENSEDIYLSLIHPDDLNHFLSNRESIRNQEDIISQVEYRIKNKKGNWNYLLSRDSVFKRDIHGKAIQYIAATTDISEIKKANDKVVFKNQELEFKNNELASFTSVASHDLKEPLRKISIFSKLIQERESKSLSDSTKYNLERIIISAERMQQLIEDLLSYSQINIHKIVYTKTDLNSQVKKVLGDLKEIIEENEAIIEIGKLPTLPVIPSQIQQVFTNLLTNALKYRKKESIKIQVFAEAIMGSEIEHLGANLDIEYSKITVKDNGIGFPTAFEEKVFEPFKRLHGKDEFSGSGLGLAICKKIMVNHKGFIIAKSEAGEGSEFILYLPLK